MKSFKLLLSVFVALINNSLALQCYSCGWDAGNTNDNCLERPSLVENGVLNCNRRYCYSIRVEEGRQVESMYRSCTDTPQYINRLIRYDDYRIYHLACTTDLCNSGTGREIFNSGSGSGGVLYVPGIGNGGSTVIKTEYTFITSLIILLVCSTSI